jgi:glutamate racemase
MQAQPIGVMDSGLGGLSVWRALVERMPDERYVYFGDSAFCPYGSRPAGQITQRATRVVDVMIENGCKLVVVACNAMTAAAIDFLRVTYPIPFIGMEPAIKPASMHTRTGVIGVLATERTLTGRLFRDTRAAWADHIEVVTAAGHGLVEQVEKLDFDGPQTMALLNRYLQPMMARNMDHLVLGCTHYPFLEAAIRRIVGTAVTLVDPAPAVARHTAAVLTQKRLRHRGKVAGRSIFYTTGNTAIMQHMLSLVPAVEHEVRTAFG